MPSPRYYIGQPQDSFDGLISPIGRDKHGGIYSADAVAVACMKLINVEDYFYGRAKNVSKDAERAIELTSEVTERLSTAINSLVATEQKYSESAKQASSRVKDASERICQGIARVEKAANFDRLERYVELLERAASAIDQLAKLDDSGRLEKIANALR